MERVLEVIRSMLEVIITYSLFVIVITFLWQRYEIAIYGELRPDDFDTVIALVLAYSMTINVSLIRRCKNRE